MEEIHKHLKSLKLIVFTAQECMKIVDCLMTPETDKNRRFIKGNSYFTFDVKIQWRAVVLELCKLYNHTEIFNLKSLLRKLETDYPELGFTKEEIRAWQLQIKAQKSAIENMIVQRNKIYAHLDEDFDKVVYSANRRQANTLILIAQEIVDALHNRVEGSSLRIDDITNSPVLELNKVIDALEQKREYDKYFWRLHCESVGIDPDTIDDLKLKKPIK